MTNNDERPPVKFPAAAMAVTVLSVITALGTVAYFTVGKNLFSAAASSDAIPACNSPEVRQLLAKIVSNNSNAFQTRTFVDFSDIVERSYTPGVKRYCAGYLTESGGKDYTGLELTLSSVGEVIGTLIPDYPRTAAAPAVATPAVAAPAIDYGFLGETEGDSLFEEDLQLSPTQKLALFRHLQTIPAVDVEWPHAAFVEKNYRSRDLFYSVAETQPALIRTADWAAVRAIESEIAADNADRAEMEAKE